MERRGDDVPKRIDHGIELLADPTRRRIVALLALRPRRPSAGPLHLGLRRSATTRQLRLLADAGLIRWTSAPFDGRGRLYAIDPRVHGQVTAWLLGVDLGQRQPRPAWNSNRITGQASTPGQLRRPGPRRMIVPHGSNHLVGGPSGK
jgi:DNA-binding transcriptional ArsR family regulator